MLRFLSGRSAVVRLEASAHLASPSTFPSAVSPLVAGSLVSSRVPSTTAVRGQRGYATAELGNDALEWSEDAFEETAEKTLDNIQITIENEVDVNHGLPGIDTSFQMGVLTIELLDSTYVINRQTPNRQIWFSSPISGPSRFNYNHKKSEWIHYTNGTDLRDWLSNELFVQTKHVFDFKKNIKV